MSISKACKNGNFVAREHAAQGYGTSGNGSAPTTRAYQGKQKSEYRESEDGIQYRRRLREGEIWTTLANFRARIASDITCDDGVDTSRTLEIHARINGRHTTFVVSAAEFVSMKWTIEHLGAEAIVEPGHGSADRVRVAIQSLSGRIPQRCVYTHTGWRQVHGASVFLHSAGALGADGPVHGLEVQLPEQLERYLLPDIGENLREAVEAQLALRNVAPDYVMIPLLGAVIRASIGEADFALHLSGHTGVYKSELAALAQQHFGPAMTARALPGSWSSTGNALEMIASAAKDVVFVIDDYVPQGTMADRARLNAVADRVLRAQGNSSGRGRLRADATLRRARPPRGLIISTGEEVPGGQSLRARMVVIEVQRGDVKSELLTVAQQAAAKGVYAKAMAGFIRWLAPRLDQVQGDLTALSHERRSRVDLSHARTADSIAQLSAAWAIWLRYTVEMGVVTQAQAEEIEREVWSTLASLATKQHDLQLANDPVERFFALLNAVLASGKGHIASAGDIRQRHGNADQPKSLGWRRGEDGSWHPQGPCIGWWGADGIYLEPEASYAEAQRLASSSGEGIGVASTTLHRRMWERNLLLSTERRGGETRLKVRKSIDGRRRDIIHVAHTLSPCTVDADPSDPAGRDEKVSGGDQGFA